MKARPFQESIVEDAALVWLSDLSYALISGDICAPDGPAPERHAFREVILSGRFTLSVARLNPGLPPEAVQDAVRKITIADAPTLIERNRAAHKMVVDGVDIEHRRADGSIAGVRARLIDFDNPDNNDWLAINQFTVMEGQHHRRPNIVIFINRLPLAVIEMKNMADEGGGRHFVCEIHRRTLLFANRRTQDRVS